MDSDSSSTALPGCFVNEIMNVNYVLYIFIAHIKAFINVKIVFI